MACSCTKRSSQEYVWSRTIEVDGEPVTQTMVYPTLIQAKAAVTRKGGSYETRTKV